MSKYLFSIVILSYNRPDRVRLHLKHLANLSRNDIEIIFIDNFSEVPLSELVLNPDYIVIRNNRNLGAVGRNVGMKIAKGQIVITLDDDVYGLKDHHFQLIYSIMDKNKDVAAINFRINEEGTGKTTDWCHPCAAENYVDKTFETNDISEGAVAFRRKSLDELGLYPESFFISHEGPDLSFRIINAGWRVIYSPEITVIHGYDQRSRTSWRRYYYDTRNQLWFVLRNLTFSYGLKRLFIGWASMLVYSLRDGYFRYWIRAVYDSVLGARREWKYRTPPTRQAIRRWALIEKNKMSFWSKVCKRLFKNEVRA